MSSAGENEERVRRLYDAFNAADFGRMKEALAASSSVEEVAGKLGEFGRLQLELVDPDIEFDFSSLPPFTEGNVFRGHQGWLEFWRTWLGPWDGIRYEIGDVWSEGDEVLASVTQHGWIAGAPEVSTSLVGVFTFEDGRLVRLRFFEDRDSAVAAAGEGP